MKNEMLCKCDKDVLIHTKDPYLPEHIDIHECPECGAMAEFDRETGITFEH